MKLKLTELAEKITPLPWNVDGLKILAETRGVIATCPTPTSGGTFDVQLNKAYLVHCSNTLPKLVEALEECERELSVIECTGEKTVACGWRLDAARAALTLAREVEV